MAQLRTIPIAFLPILSLSLPACGDPPPREEIEIEEPSAQTNDTPRSSQPRGPKGPSGPPSIPNSSEIENLKSLGNVEKIDLTEAHVTRWLAAIKELQQAGLQAGSKLGNNPSQLQEFASGLKLKSEYEGLLKKHDLDLQSFTAVHTQVMGAYMAVVMGDQQGGIQSSMDQSLKALEGMKGIPAAQLAEVKKNLAQSKAQISTLSDDVPEKDLELVRRLRTKIEESLGMKFSR